MADLVNGQLGALGLIIFCKTLLDVEQNNVAKLPHFQGAFLAIGKAGENCKVSVIETTSLFVIKILWPEIQSPSLPLYFLAEAGILTNTIKILTLRTSCYYGHPDNMDSS